MRPRMPSFDARDCISPYVEQASYRLLGRPVFQHCSDLAHLRRRELGRAISFASIKTEVGSVSDVIRLSEVFKILASVVGFVRVFMVDLHSVWPWPNESSGNEEVYIMCDGFSLSKLQRGGKVSGTMPSWRQNAPGVRATGRATATDSPDATDFIRRLESDNGKPLFGLNLFGGKFGVGHDLNLQHRLGLWLGSLGVSRTLRAVLIVALFMLCFSSPIVAQQTDSETLKALEIANIRLKAANETIALLNDRLAAKDEIITAKDGTIAVRNEQLELAKSAGKDRAGANTIDAMRFSACETQLAKADARIYALEHPGLLQQLFAPKELLKIGGAFYLGRITAPK